MDKFVKDLLKQNKNINDILDMPIHYVTDLLREKTKVEKSDSFFDLLG